MRKKEKFTAKIVHVVDGDTIQVEKSYQRTVVRLHHIDAPEKLEPYAFKSKAFIVEHWMGCKVDVIPVTYDRYSRLVAIVMRDQKYNLSAEMLISGLAFWYRRFSKDVVYKHYESIARLNKINLWSHPRYFQQWINSRLLKQKKQIVYTTENLIDKKNRRWFYIPRIPSNEGIDAIHDIEEGFIRISQIERSRRDGLQKCRR